MPQSGLPRAGEEGDEVTYLYRCPECGKRFERDNSGPRSSFCNVVNRAVVLVRDYRAEAVGFRRSSCRAVAK